MAYNFYIPTRIIGERGGLKKLHLQNLPGDKALVAISCGKSAKQSGSLDSLLQELKLAGKDYFVFDKIPSNPTTESVSLGAEAARNNNCDFVVALGGGSVMDASKAIAVVAANGGSWWNYVAAGTGKGLPVKNKPLPIVAVTTTAGTGSEADATSVITNPETGEKIGFVHPGMFPVLSVADPELTLGVPPLFTAYQGFDALFHATECYLSNKANMMSEMYSLTSAEYIGRYLERAVKDGSDIEAREGMTFANTLSGMVMTLSGCMSKHGMEHAMSALSPKLAHGAGLIMLAPAYYGHFIDIHACDEKFIRLAKALGGQNVEEPKDFLTELEKLMAACGVDNLKMSDYGITEDDFASMADNAASSMSRVFLNDPVPLFREDCIEIYRKSYR
ncbi:MAG: iron-containing alcohol dehydrogenase [Clostridia bacterium]|nr:iron-containing alcohol dehydrogenase [Clostridia bacterium]